MTIVSPPVTTTAGASPLSEIDALAGISFVCTAGANPVVTAAAVVGTSSVRTFIVKSSNFTSAGLAILAPVPPDR